MQAQSIDSSGSSSDSDDFYSGAAKRFKKTKAAKFTAGKVELINSMPNGKLSSKKRSPSPANDATDSSEEDLFREIGDANTDVEEEEDLDQEMNHHTQQVETLEDVEGMFHVSPENSCHTVDDRRTSSSAASAYVVDDDDEIEEADPLAFQSLNDSVSIF